MHKSICCTICIIHFRSKTIAAENVSPGMGGGNLRDGGTVLYLHCFGSYITIHLSKLEELYVKNSKFPFIYKLYLSFFNEIG